MTEGRWKTLREFLNAVTDRAGTDVAVAKLLGFSDGSRVGQWRAGRGRPSEYAMIRLARWMGENPLTALRLAEYTDMADALEGTVPAWTPEVEHVKAQLKGLEAIIKSTLRSLE